jgi:uncharacterized RDD family membrane protein YckC
MFCPNCGHEASADEAICMDCGHNLRDTLENDKVETPKPVRRLHFGRPDEQEDLFSSKPKAPTIKEILGDSRDEEIEDWELDIGHIGTPAAPPVNKADKKPVARKPKAPVRKTPTLDELAATEFDFGSAAKARAVAPNPRPTALGDSPLDDAPDNTQKTSEELKRVLQTVFATSQGRPQADPTAPQRPKTSDAEHAGTARPPVPPIKPKAAPPALSKARPSEEAGWDLGTEATISDPPLVLIGDAQDKPDEDVASSAPPVTPAAEISRKSGPDMADFWSSSSTRSKQRQMAEGPRHDVDVGDADEDEEAEAPDGLEARGDAQPERAAAFVRDDDGETEADDGPTERDAHPARPNPAFKEDVQEVQVTVAGVGRRLLALVIDGLLSFAVTVFFLMAAVWLLGPARLPNLDASGPWYLVRLAIDHSAVLPAYAALYLFLSFLLAFVCMATTGQTPGKMLMDVRVIQTDGEPLTPFRVIVRMVGFVLAMLPFMLGLLWAVIDSRKQGIHDKLADSYVIRSSSLSD